MYIYVHVLIVDLWALLDLYVQAQRLLSPSVRVLFVVWKSFAWINTSQFKLWFFVLYVIFIPSTTFLNFKTSLWFKFSCHVCKSKHLTDRLRVTKSVLLVDVELCTVSVLKGSSFDSDYSCICSGCSHREDILWKCVEPPLIIVLHRHPLLSIKSASAPPLPADTPLHLVPSAGSTVCSWPHPQTS